MTMFRYKAKMKNAQTVLGHIEAQTQEEAVEKIHQMGLVPVTVEGGDSDEQNSFKASAGNAQRIKERNIPSKTLFRFSRQLSNLIKSGVSILRALELVVSQTKDPYLKAVMSQVHDEVKDGTSFSEALTRYPKIFSNFYVTMVKAGEESGNLKGAISDIANFFQEQEQIKSKVRSAVAYPVFMALFGLGTVAYILISVMPKIMVIFENVNQTLPFPTQVVMALSNLLIRHGWWMLIGAGIFVLLIKQWDRTREGRLYKSKVILALPFLGDFYLKVD